MFTKGNMETLIIASLMRLNVKKVHTLYAHAPDPATSIVEQAANFDHFYRSGLYDRLDLCNYSQEMVREWIRIALENNYILPSVYQGQYNILCRGYEDELFPLLRNHGMDFAATSPLAGGFLTGKLTFSTSVEDLKEHAGHALSYVCLAEAHEATPVQCAMRWLLFHSPLQSTDAVIIGPSNMEQLDEYLEARDAGLLPNVLAHGIEQLFPPVKTAAAPMLAFGLWTV